MNGFEKDCPAVAPNEASLVSRAVQPFGERLQRRLTFGAYWTTANMFENDSFW